MMKRRQLLQTLGAASVLTLGLPRASLGQSGLATTSLGAGLTLISGAGSNVLVAEGPDSVVVVDGGLETSAGALLSAIRDLSGNKPIAAVFNTNWRPSRSGLNHLLGPSGTPIIAHENTRLWQSAEIEVDWQDKAYLPLPKAAQANQTFYKTGSFELGAEVIEYGFISQCNTDGDIYVHFTRADVLVVGDMLGTDSYLLLDYVTGGWINGAQKTTAGLLARAGAGTRVIAATGGVLGRAQLEEQTALLDHAYDKVAQAFQTGRSLEQFLASDPMADYRSRWGDPTLFVTLLYKGTWFHVPGRAVRNII
jgi:cyclase